MEKVLLLMKFFAGLIILFGSGLITGYFLHLDRFFKDHRPEHIERK